MPSLLIVTTDPNEAADIEQLAAERSLRVRTVSTATAAREWLSMQSWDLLFIDARFEEERPINLLNLGWKYNPYLVAGVFQLHGIIQDEWTPKVMGAHVFSGPQAQQDIRKVLRALPEKLQLGQDFPILVVEDLDSPRDIVCAYIESLGYPQVKGVGSVKEALGLLREDPGHFYCVLTDINMPGESGIDLTEQIRSDPDLNHLPIIVLTSHSTPDNLIACAKAGATGFLVKPPKKKLLRVELEKARRILFSEMSPRLCKPEDAEQLEDAILRFSL